MARAQSLEDYAERRTRIAGGAMMKPGAISESIDALKQIYLQPLDALEAERIAAAGQFTSFANYDYVGLGQDVRVREAAASAALELGVGAGASRLVGGSHSIHEALEREIAAFLRVEDSVSLVSGYLTNASLIGHLMTKSDQVLVDELSHNSIVAGAEMTRARVDRFPHNDFDYLEALLKERQSSARRTLIVVEGLYSMDGDVPDLPRLLELRDRYDAWLLVDEAHSIGVLGETGRGIAEHFGVDADQIDLIVGTLSKTFGASGGFIAGRRRVMDWLRFTLPAFVFSVGLSPVVVQAVRAGIAVLEAEPWRVAKLQDNARFFLEEARKRGLDVGEALGTGVVTIQFSTHDQCMLAAQALLKAGYYAPPIPLLAVPKNRPRIRFFISAMHEQARISDALNVVEAAVKAAPDAAIEAFEDTPAEALSA